MATKKKSNSPSGLVKKALVGIEKAQRELQLNIKNLKTAMGHSYRGGAEDGHTYSPSGRMKGHPHTASGRVQGHTHTAS